MTTAPAGTAVAVEAVARLLDVLDLAPAGPDRWVGDCVAIGLTHVFGGQLLAQALVAASRTVAPGRDAHSLHAYFLRAGDPARPVGFDVTRLRDGRRLSARSVTVHQDGRTLAVVTSSFTATPDDDQPAEVAHTLRPPGAASPDSLPSLAEHAATHGGLSEAWSGLEAVDCRVDPAAQHLVWLRIAAPTDAGDARDPVLQQAMLAYLSDVTLLAGSLLGHGIAIGVEEVDGRRWNGVSLDHVVWFHRPVRADRWLLHAQSSPSAGAGRALTRAEIFDEHGAFAASVAQEGLFLVGSS